MSSPVYDGLSEVIVDAAGEIVYADSSADLAAFSASGTTQSGQYFFEVFDNAGNLVADLSPYARSRHFTVRRNRAEQVSLSFDQGQLEELAATLGTTVRAL